MNNQESHGLEIITQPEVIDKILDHLASKGSEPGRRPPEEVAESAAASG